jgi:hypothetical protein
VPAQFLGLARLFIRRADVAAAETIAWQGPMIAEVSKRLDRGVHQRPEQLDELERQFRAMNREDLLPGERSAVLIKRIRRKMSVLYVWTTGGNRTQDDWCPKGLPTHAWNSEETLDIFACRLEFTPKAMDIKTVIVASVGVHALGRRFQRGFRNSDNAIKGDLAVLMAEARKTGLSGDKDFSIPCADGEWHGEVMRMDDSQGVGDQH